MKVGDKVTYTPKKSDHQLNRRGSKFDARVKEHNTTSGTVTLAIDVGDNFLYRYDVCEGSDEGQFLFIESEETPKPISKSAMRRRRSQTSGSSGL